MAVIDGGICKELLPSDEAPGSLYHSIQEVFFDRRHEWEFFSQIKKLNIIFIEP